MNHTTKIALVYDLYDVATDLLLHQKAFGGLVVPISSADVPIFSADKV
jgi:hypothetical protein